MAKRRIFIGDIHGCLAEFEDLLERLGFDPDRDEIFPVGDLVNRGPDSVGCVRLAKRLGARTVLGNHDVHLLRQAQDESVRGDRSTLQEFAEARDGRELLRWLSVQPLCRVFEDVVQIHAGVHPLWDEPDRVLDGKGLFDPGDDDVEFAVRARHCDAEGRRPDHDWPMPGAPYRPWDAFWRERPGETRTVVFGHWARRGAVHEERTRGLDTGCLYGGDLTAWIPEGDQIVRVPARKVWYETSR